MSRRPNKTDPNFDPSADLSWLENPELSCWSGRCKGARSCDSKDFFDNKATLKATFASDWENTSGGMFLKGDQKGRAFGSKLLTAEVLRQIHSVLDAWFPMLTRVFTYYSCVGVEASGVVHAMSYLGFSTLLEEGGLIEKADESEAGRRSRHAKPRAEDGWDLLWVAVNQSAMSKSQKEWNANNRLTRAEFLEILVRCAIDDCTRAEDMPACVDRICEDLLSIVSELKHAGSILHQGDAFRRMYCYREEVCAVIKHHNTTLKSIFTVYASGATVDGQTAKTGASGGLMGLDEWMDLMGDLGFVKELTPRKAYLVFAQSRMIVVDETGLMVKNGATVKNSRSQLTQLSYEGFLEAIVRVALIKGLPSDKEMRRQGFQYPGELFGAKLDLGLVAFNEWIEYCRLKNRRGHGDPIWRRLDMLLLLIVNVMQFGVEKTEGGAALLLRGSPDEMLSFEEVKRYAAHPTTHVFETGGGSKQQT